MSGSSPRRFAGFVRPNYTMVPDQLFDELLPDLTGAELKVLLYIIRRTYGFKRDADSISLSQMLTGITTRAGRVLDRGTGLSKKTLLQALRSLEDLGCIITERRQSLERGNEPTVYRLNVIGTPLGEEMTPPSGEKPRQGEGGETPPRARGKNHTTQETVEQKTDSQETGDSSLRLPTPSAFVDYDDDHRTILAYVEDFAREFSDRAPLKSSTTRAYRLYQRSGLDLTAFIQAMLQARAIVKERSAAIRSTTREPGRVLPTKRRMAYWFAVLEQSLGLRDQVGPAH